MLIFNVDGVFKNDKVLYFKKPLRKEMPDEKEVEAAILFVDLFCDHSVSFNRTGSYGMKHVVERFFGTYISNGALILAFKKRGFGIKVFDDGPNCRIKFKFKKRVARIMERLEGQDRINITREAALQRLGELVISRTERY